jgi:hypothetical protein
MLIAYKLGLMVAAALMTIHSVDVAVKAGRDAYLLWNAPRHKPDGK